MLQTVDKFRHILQRVETEAVHTCVELDVYGEVAYTVLLSLAHKSVEQSERVHLWFKVVVEHSLERRHLRVHNHYVRCDAVLAQCHTLICHCHSQIVYTVVLQRLGYLYGTGSVGISLYHAHEFGLGLHERTVEVEILDDVREVHFEYGFMYLLHKQFGDIVKSEAACALNQNHLVAQCLKHSAVDERCNVMEEELFGHLYHVCMVHNLRSDTYNLVHTTLHAEF